VRRKTLQNFYAEREEAGRKGKNMTDRKDPSPRKIRRQRRKRDLETIARETLQSPVTIRIGGKLKKVPFFEASIRSNLAEAIKGDPRALSVIAELIESTGLQHPMS
jgi:hypothetical protein